MSLVENINKRKKAGTSRSKSKSTVSDKAYAEMQAGYRDGGMVDQMSAQMGITEQKAGGLMRRASMMNDMSGPPGMGGFEMNRGMGGTVMVVRLGRMSPMRYRPEERDEDSSLIKSTENQVRARHFNNNGGKGTF